MSSPNFSFVIRNNSNGEVVNITDKVFSPPSKSREPIFAKIKITLERTEAILNSYASSILNSSKTTETGNDLSVLSLSDSIDDPALDSDESGIRSTTKTADSSTQTTIPCKLTAWSSELLYIPGGVGSIAPDNSDSGSDSSSTPVNASSNGAQPAELSIPSWCYHAHAASGKKPLNNRSSIDVTKLPNLNKVIKDNGKKYRDNKSRVVLKNQDAPRIKSRVIRVVEVNPADGAVTAKFVKAPSRPVKLLPSRDWQNAQKRAKLTLANRKSGNLSSV